MITTMKYRLKPTKTQVAAMYRTLDVCRETYNLSLETKIVAYENSKVHLSNFDLPGMYTHALDRQRCCLFVGDHCHKFYHNKGHNGQLGGVVILG